MRSEADHKVHAAQAFASGGSPRPASQEAQSVTKGAGVQSLTGAEPGRTLPIHPVILRDVPARPDNPPTQAQLNRLHRALNPRDLVILEALFDYRYLNSLQIKELFFPSLRSCQMRLRSLADLGVLHCWKVIETPGVRRRHSLILISTLGARVLADRHGDGSRPYLERVRSARDHCWHALHDLEANQVFVSLAVDSRGLPDEGLLVWQGEDHVRVDYRQRAREYRWPAPAPDGRGIYVTAAGRVQFDLEWDRATESIARLRQKIASQVGFWRHFRDPESHHVLIVLPSAEREARVHRAIWAERPRYRHEHCCAFWTTTAHRLQRWGPAGAIWLSVDLRAAEPPRTEELSLRLRAPLNRLASIEPSPRAVGDCIGKPYWWLRRPGGGEVT